jgi:MoxR-like ATPase
MSMNNTNSPNFINPNLQAVAPVVEKFAAMRADLNARFRQRETLTELALAAIVAGQNIITTSSAGEGKTAFFEALGKYVKDGQHFSVGLCKSTTDSDLFGGPDVPHLVQTGGYRRNTSGFLPCATTALLDEAFKGEGALLQSMLRFFSELEFEGKPVPLLFAAIASNELPPELRGATSGVPMDLGPMEESLLAFVDRFLYKYEVAPLDPGTPDWEEVVFAGVSRRANPLVGVTQAEIRSIRAAVAHVDMPQSIIDALRTLSVNLPLGMEGVADSQVKVSTRTWVKSVSALKAHALLAGREQVNLSDLDWLEHAFWTTPDQRSHIAAQISRVKTAKMAEADTSLRKAQEYYKALTLNTLASDSSEDGLIIEAHRLDPKTDARAATAGAKLMEYCNREVISLRDSLLSATGEDAQAVNSAIIRIEAIRENTMRAVAVMTKSTQRNAFRR